VKGNVVVVEGGEAHAAGVHAQGVGCLGQLQHPRQVAVAAEQQARAFPRCAGQALRDLGRILFHSVVSYPQARRARAGGRATAQAATTTTITPSTASPQPTI